MTILFAVVWTVQVWVSMPCPDFKPDPYTGEYPAAHCLVLHGKFVNKQMEKEFWSKKEARAFIKAAPAKIKPGMKIEKRTYTKTGRVFMVQE